LRVPGHNTKKSCEKKGRDEETNGVSPIFLMILD